MCQTVIVNTISWHPNRHKWYRNIVLAECWCTIKTTEPEANKFGTHDIMRHPHKGAIYFESERPMVKVTWPERVRASPLYKLSLAGVTLTSHAANYAYWYLKPIYSHKVASCHNFFTQRPKISIFTSRKIWHSRGAHGSTWPGKISPH